MRGHWARPNPQARHAGAALAIVHGPHAYVSPNWYPDKEADARVPTWNYAVAHLHGAARDVRRRGHALADLVAELSAQHEAASAATGNSSHERDDHRNQLRGIVGFRFVVRRAAAMKFKLNQNHPRANRVAVAERLEALATAQPRGGRADARAP